MRVGRVIIRAKVTTADGRITAGRWYYGGYLKNINRVVVFDDKQEWMTFNKDAFEIASEDKYARDNTSRRKFPTV